ncbi:flavin reductase (DIM6/NTAB) family NADH-FMN oxidoreductase RutF [Cricetibacter osteomyelitidis]|uniref:Flavin reductase (DIM6/NTAB) family NADH-FMN oxidoreductase RutF n=1 Tax=Cricetibacter osteomyelitidis TaxID=1521931 RepID=A0A4V2T1G9_9PAST|nr:flavin reductase family protein [Cricetibacter osteomyelitidis]TCP93403.1 flavin reductase (DIM6/NTAB) family NADH-FMN oxidoreductase RutF [Cricetibacter osteomyelitidis]
MAIQPVALEKFYRLINHGPTTMISAKHNGIENVMSASWVCALDYQPTAKLTIVVDKGAYTRGLIEQSGYFAVQLPTVQQAELVLDMGESRKDVPNKLDRVELFYQQGFDVPLVKNCAAWIICKVIPEPENHQKHDLFIGEVLAAWADDRIFRNGYWHFDDAPDELKTVHYVAGGQFYMIGKGFNLKRGPNVGE